MHLPSLHWQPSASPQLSSFSALPYLKECEAQKDYETNLAQQAAIKPVLEHSVWMVKACVCLTNTIVTEVPCAQVTEPCDQFHKTHERLVQTSATCLYTSRLNTRQNGGAVSGGGTLSVSTAEGPESRGNMDIPFKLEDSMTTVSEVLSSLKYTLLTSVSFIWNRQYAN